MSLHSQTPICVQCVRNYDCQRNGVKVRLQEDVIIDADLYECPSCAHQIVRGFATEAVDPYGDYPAVYASWDKALGTAVIGAPHMNEVYA